MSRAHGYSGSPLSDGVPTAIAETTEESTPGHDLPTHEDTKPQDGELSSQHEQSHMAVNDETSRVPCHISLAGDDDPRFAGWTQAKKDRTREKERKRLAKIRQAQRLALR